MENRHIHQMDVYCSEKEHKIRLEISNCIISNTKIEVVECTYGLSVEDARYLIGALEEGIEELEEGI